jgi:hypothetical protein
MFQQFPVRITEGHKYVHIDKPDISIVPLTRVLDSFEHEFDADMISACIAKSRSLTGNQDEINKIQKSILYEWEKEGSDARLRGNIIDSNLTSQFKTGDCLDPEWKKLCSSIFRDMHYGGENTDIRVQQECWDKDYHIGGMSDRMVVRSTRAKTLIGDYYDTKSNKKIKSTNDSNNKFMKAPLDFLLQCDYNRYCLQLSGYAYMGEKSFGIKPGALYIELIKGPYDAPEYLPVPYMKYVVEMMFKAYRSKVIMSNDDENW